MNSLLSNGIALNATVLAVEAKIFKDTEGKRVLNFYKAAEKSKVLTYSSPSIANTYNAFI